jgi:hypothetical protein
LARVLVSWHEQSGSKPEGFGTTLGSLHLKKSRFNSKLVIL